MLPLTQLGLRPLTAVLFENVIGFKASAGSFTK
jgi:hypothetical protein